MKLINLLAIVLLSLSINVFAKTNIWEGTPLPQFELKDQNGDLKTNADFSDQWLVVYFYPKDKTPGCTVEAQNFTDDYAKFQAMGANIIGVSYDDVESHKDFAETYELPFTLLADTEAELSKAMKVNKIFPFPHASRQTFLVGPDGLIKQHFEKVNPESHSKELLQVLSQHNKASN